MQFMVECSDTQTAKHQTIMTKKSKKVLRGKLKEALKEYFDADVGSLNTYDLQIVAVEAFEELIKEKYIVVK